DEGSGDTGEFIRICRDAEAAGIESVHVPIASPLSDALALATAAGTEVPHVGFRIGWHFDGVLASLVGRELKKAWETLGGRLIIHMSLGGDEPAVNGNYLSAGEFIANCRRLFTESEAPRFDVEGQTAEAAFLAIKHGDCLWRLPNRPNQVYADALPVLHFGKEAGLIASVIARETREEAVDAAPTPLPEHAAVIGSFDEVARTIHGFKKNGISQFLIRELPGGPEMVCFGARVLPLIRAIESGQAPN
ncbi:MAG TPA: hypothetical protein VGV35_04305, partial [Bryobacteraceae bacterium]|nr:hypothetical protein [Bryobacteraceae bacterium]